ncbi:MAG: FAD-binding protein [Planctomycetota bacterium]
MVPSDLAMWPCAALPNAELGSRTTLRIGGSTEWLLEPADPEEFVAAWNAARERGFLPRVLGHGANVLVDDGLHAGVVIATERINRVFRPSPEATGEAGSFDPEPSGAVALDRESDPRLVAWAGAPLPTLVRTANRLGWTGLEGLAGVPGHLGGGVAMNAGGRWGAMWDVVERVRLLLPDGTTVEREREQCSPGYREGGLAGAICLGAVLALTVEHPTIVTERAKQFLREKNAVQPVTERSSGCVFKNPDPELSDGRSAGRLIDDAGGKGLRRGDAVVSEKHANFFVNRGSARAQDVWSLIVEIQRLVLEATGVELETEVQIWRR